MKILAIADVESKRFWDYFKKEYLEGIDLIISCGDLKAEYLSFLATFTKAPVLYVHGNHDDDYAVNAPGGCINIENKIIEYKGLRIVGFGGSMRYKPNGTFQYTEAEMFSRYQLMRIMGKLKKGIDILVTHAPSLKHGKATDLCHRGFRTFDIILEKYNPKVHLHGHTHLNYGLQHQREQWHNGTRILNAYDHFIFEIED